MSPVTTTPSWTATELLARVRKTTELGNAERLADRMGGRLLYVHSIGWLAWDGRRWQRALTGEETRAASDMVRGIYAEAAQLAEAAAAASDDTERQRISSIAEAVSKWARNSESASRIKAALELGRSQTRLVARVEDLDANPKVLNVANGVLDLEKLELREHDPVERLTRVTNAAHETAAAAPFWESLVELVLPDPKVRRWVQMAAGYSMLGQYSEYLFIPYGSGANGKSSFLWGLRHALGDYAGETAPELLVSRREWGAASDSALASLRGRRLVTTMETEQGKRMAEVLVKQLTGEADITAKFMRQDYFTYSNQAAVWLGTNHKPVVQGMDYAIWRRIRLIPFDVTIPEGERLNPEVVRNRLRGERDGILRWLVEGLRTFYQRGSLDPAPEAVDEATAAYKSVMDPLADWLEDECVADESAFTPNPWLRTSYTDHCERNGRHHPLGATRWGELLEELGFTRAKRSVAGKQHRGFDGVRLVNGRPFGLQ